jgi:serine/threonine protein kinase
MPFQTPSPGDIFDHRYQLLSVLGAGGIGTVFKAKQIDADRLVALKVLHPQIAIDEEFKLRFLREAQALGKLSNPNIVTVYHMGVSQEGLPYLVMELINGRSLRSLLNENNSLQPARVFKIMKQLVGAMACIHEAGIVHRDIKPDNIVLMDEPEKDFVKIIDFGLAKMDSNFGEQKLTSTGILIGSLNYMSPEQCQGRKTDFRSDLYSLSVCLYEMLAGTPPFFADNAVGLMYKHASAEAPELKLHTGQMINPSVASFVKKGLEKDPANRFQSAVEMDAELAQLIEIFTNESIASKSKLLAPPPKLLAAMLAIAIISSATAAVLYFKNKSQAEKELKLVASDSSKHNDLSQYVNEVVSRRGSTKKKMEDLLQICENHSGTPYALAAAKAAYKLGENSNDPEIYNVMCRARLRVAQDESRSGHYHDAIKLVAPLLKLNESVVTEGVTPRQIQDAKAVAARSYQLSGNESEALRLVHEIIGNASEIFGDASVYPLQILLQNHQYADAAILLKKTRGFTALLHDSTICRKAKQWDLAAIAVTGAKSVLLEPRLDRNSINADEICISCEEIFLDCSIGKKAEAQEVIKNILAKPKYLAMLKSGYNGINTNFFLGMRCADMIDQALKLLDSSTIDGVKKNILEADILIAGKRFAQARKVLAAKDVVVDPNTNRRRLALDILADIENGKYDYHRAFLKTDHY